MTASAPAAPNTSGLITSPLQMACLAVAVLGNLSPFLLPVIVGAMVDHLGLSIQYSTVVATAEMAGLGVGAAIFSHFVLTANWRILAMAGVILAVATNLITPFLDGVWQLAAARHFSGIGSGILIAVSATGLTSTARPERVLGAASLFSLAVGSTALYMMPQILDKVGVVAMFWTLAGLCAAVIVVIPGMPKRSPYIDRVNVDEGMTARPDDESESETHSSAAAAKQDQTAPASLPVRLSAVIAVMMFFIGAMLFWVYVERVGVQGGLSVDEMSSSLGLGQSLGVIGALIPLLIGVRLGGRMAPMIVLIMIPVIGSLAMVSPTEEIMIFTISISSLTLAWTALYPYMMGVMFALDPSAKLVTHALTLQTIGKAIGPAFGAFLVTGDDFAPAYWFCAGVFALSLVLFLPGVWKSDKILRAENRK